MLAFNISPQPTQLSLTPFIDIYEMHDKVIVLADMPGVSKEEVDISVVGNLLTVRGRCSRDIHQSPTIDGIRLIRECPHCDYHRTLKLSDAIETEGIQAQMQDGVLTLTLPKKQVTQTIEVSISVE